jgi:hypothetical protein
MERCSQPNTEQRDQHTDNRGEENPLSPPIDHLSREQAADGEKKPCHWGTLLSRGNVNDDIAESSSNEEEEEID